MSDDRTTPSHLVEVTQADRDAAQHFVIAPENQAKIRNGEMDWNPAVQAFARHRLSAQRSCDAEVVKLREALQTASDIIIAHHQWHAAQTTPDAEFGFIPADEYADSGLYERTVNALDKVGRILNPVRDFAADAIEAGKHRNAEEQIND